MALGKKEYSGSGSAGKDDVMRATQGILHDLAFDKMFALLKNLCKQDNEIKRTNSQTGKEEIDYPSTLSLIRTKCRQTIDDVEALESYFAPKERD